MSRGSWGQQPGAVCLSLGSCRENCMDSEGNAISRCSATGWDDGEVQAETADPCDDCTSGQFCDKSGSLATIACRCNPLTGFDACKRYGQCVDRCVKFQARMDEFNSIFPPCSEDSECSSGFDCSDTATARVMTCSDGAVSFTESSGSCEPQSRTMTEAEFGSTGQFITVSL